MADEHKYDAENSAVQISSFRISHHNRKMFLIKFIEEKKLLGAQKTPFNPRKNKKHELGQDKGVRNQG